jgi:hypothetical protein
VVVVRGVEVVEAFGVVDVPFAALVVEVVNPPEESANPETADSPFAPLAVTVYLPAGEVDR